MLGTSESGLIKPKKARQELASRELARRHMVDFSAFLFPWYQAARHHRLVGEYLEQVERYIATRGQEGIGRLLVFEHPRAGKSEQVSKHFPAWVLGRQPDTRIIMTSYNADRATDNNRAVREIIQSDHYQALFGKLAQMDAPIELSTDSRAVQEWNLAAPHRGGILAAGVGGGITGAGAHLFIVDDPFKNREEAESEARREMVWNWWTSSAYTRLEDGAAVIGMMTRWHGDDWAGRLLQAMATNPLADRWTVVSIPAIWEEPNWPVDKTRAAFKEDQLMAGVWIEESDPLGREIGEAMWPEKYSAADLERIRANIGEYDWQALYQQQPYSRDGNLFKREWMPVVDVGPKPDDIVARVRYWDKAASAKGDFSVGVLMCLTRDGVIFVEHVARGRWTPYEREKRILETAQADKDRPGPMVIIWHPQDPGAAGLDSAQATQRMLAQQGFTARFEVVSGSKVVRSGPWSTACEAGMVRLNRGGWNTAFVEEHVAFPKGKYDDQVDGASSAHSKLRQRPRRAAQSYQG